MRLKRIVAAGVLIWAIFRAPADAQTVGVMGFQEIAERMVHMRVPDARAAARLRRLKLMERVPADSVGALSSWDAGPLIRRELQRLVESTASQPAPLDSVPMWRLNPVHAPPIENGEPAVILETVRLYAQEYASSIPDFLCIRDSRFFQDGSGTGKWKQDAHVGERLAHFDGEDTHQIVAIDGKPVEGDVLYLHGGITVSGEFGNIMRRIFEEKSQTAFYWLGGEDGHESGRIRIGFRVEKENSSLTVSAGDEDGVVTGYAGELLASAETGQIFRIQLTMDELPEGYPMRGGSWDIRYGPVKVEEQELLLPVRAVTETYQEGAFLRNEATYRDYQKYSADSSIRFERAEPELIRP